MNKESQTGAWIKASEVQKASRDARDWYVNDVKKRLMDEKMRVKTECTIERLTWTGWKKRPLTAEEVEVWPTVEILKYKVDNYKETPAYRRLDDLEHSAKFYRQHRKKAWMFVSGDDLVWIAPFLTKLEDASV